MGKTGAAGPNNSADARAALDEAVAHRNIPVTAFWSITHRCADWALAVKSARSAVSYGVWCVAESPQEVSMVASLRASETLLANSPHHRARLAWEAVC